MAKRLHLSALTAGMVLGSINLVTLAPLVGLWVGAKFTGDKSISVLAVGVTVVVAMAVGIAIVRALTWLGDEHDRVTGRPRVVRAHTPWLRSLSGERTHHPDSAIAPMSTLDYVLVVVVVATVLAFEIWFLLFSGSPLDQRSGRG